MSHNISKWCVILTTEHDNYWLMAIRTSRPRTSLQSLRKRRKMDKSAKTSPWGISLVSHVRVSTSRLLQDDDRILDTCAHFGRILRCWQRLQITKVYIEVWFGNGLWLTPGVVLCNIFHCSWWRIKDVTFFTDEQFCKAGKMVQPCF